MSKLKRTLLHGLLFASLVASPVGGFAMGNHQGEDMSSGQDSKTEKQVMPRTDTQKDPKVDETLPKVEQTSSRVRFGVYYGRPYYYRPYYHYYPYRPYYNRYNNYPYYRSYGGYYRW